MVFAMHAQNVQCTYLPGKLPLQFHHPPQVEHMMWIADSID